MARVSIFDSPFLLGFDHIERLLDDISRASTSGYPPYNIEQTGPVAMRITLAVAGFQPSELDVTVEAQKLEISGRQSEETDRVFLHRGIAARQFRRSFVLAEGMEVEGAFLDKGLLNVDLVRIDPKPAIRRVEIGSSGTGGGKEDVPVGAATGAQRHRGSEGAEHV